MNLKNKKVTVIGLGNSGVNAATLLNRLGADVRVTDSHDTPAIRNSLKLFEDLKIKVQIGGHTEDFIRGSDLVVVSPGVENSSPVIRWADKLGMPIMGEMELGFRFCKGRIIAITGTNGKSTVTKLTGDILKNGGRDVIVCGNIGNSLCGEIPRINEKTWVVLEASSFQLERMDHFKPKIAVILNITDDHMDRYKDFKEYFNEKLKIFSNQDKDDILALNYDALPLRDLKDKARSKVLFYSRSIKTDGAYLRRQDTICCAYNGVEKEICRVADIRIKGLHNIENVLAASLVATIVGVRGDAIRDAIKNFKGLKHRFETLDRVGGVEYIDDSKGTTVDSTVRALESCEKPVILIAGGKDKFSDYSLARDAIRKKVRYAILIGEAKDKIGKALDNVTEIRKAKDMFEAVEMAHGLAKENWLVLLSPMCSSFDMFKDYNERGEVFKEAVKAIKYKYEKVNA